METAPTYEITVEWPDGRTATTGGFPQEAVEPMVSLLITCGAVLVICRHS